MYSAVFVFALSFGSLVSLATCMPSPPPSRIAYAPAIKSPHGGEIWLVGDREMVRWDTAHTPPSVRNNTGSVYLGWQANEQDSEHLDLDHPLASGFPIMRGHVRVTVPDVQPRSNYFVVLFGDSGNASPKFAITHDH